MLLIVFLGVLLAVVDGQELAGCCNFEPGTTYSWTTSTWQWTDSGSYPVTNDYPGFIQAGNYLWIQNDSGTVALSSLSIKDQYTIISFDYYYDTPNPNTGSYFHVYFHPETGSTTSVLLFETAIPMDEWIHKDIPCNDQFNYCCGSIADFPCAGTIEIIGSLSVFPATGLIGVDNVGTCVPTVECCNFDNSDVCSYVNDPTNAVNWFFDGTLPPIYTPPPPSDYTSYIYFEYIDYQGASPLDSDYNSKEISIPQTVDFQIEYYVASPYGLSGDSGLKIFFVESATKIKTELAYYKSSYNNWQFGTFSCGTVFHDCCLGQGSCAGWLQFEGHIEPLGGTVFVGVNTISILGTSC
ncbi:hypothetical protein CHUAL_004181 [Chamberlinius hualienensis]